MGNGKSGVECVIKTDKTFYFAGDTVTGQLYIHATKKFPCGKVVLNIIGTEEAEFRVDDRPCKGLHSLINTTFVLYQWPGKAFLLGQYVFPFAFSLPTYLPGSYSEVKSNYKAKIRYSCKVTLVSNSSDVNNVEVEHEYILREPQRDGAEMLYGEIFAYPKTCCCLRKGVSKVSCYFEKNYYFPGDECLMICEADNSKCSVSVVTIKCDLIKSVTLAAFNGKQAVLNQTINTVYFPGIGPALSYAGDEAKKQKISLTYKDAQVTPSTSGNVVRCEYYLSVGPVYSGLCKGKAECVFAVKVTVLQKAAVAAQLLEPQDWHPQVYPDSKIILSLPPSNKLLDNMEQDM